MKKTKFLEQHPRHREQIVPYSDGQALLMSAIELDSPMVVTTGYAGTGKTYVPTTMAADLLIDGTFNGGVDKIILTRPNEASGRPIGFRPGTMIEKMSEWFAEQLSILKDRMGPNEVELAIRRGKIEMVPFETMRGRSFRDAFILLDEAQNTSPAQMKMFVTRIGESSRAVVNGDVLQSDLRGASGLSVLLEIIRENGMEVPIIEFTKDEIVRSKLCREFIINWEKWEKQ
jgi:phosphate starvation-inducible PhoH-like protein